MFVCHLEGRIVEVILIRPLRPETVTGKTKGEAIATEVPFTFVTFERA